MSASAEWSAEALPQVLLVLAPHPDDDVLGCSLLMRRVAAAGKRIVIVWLTDGGASHGDLSPNARRRLVERRQAEGIAGVSALGVAPEATHFLGFQDGALAQCVDEARQHLQCICSDHGVDMVVVTDKGDGHPDHRAAFLIASQLNVARLYSYPISARYDGDAYAPPDGAVHIPSTDHEIKRGALLRHQSQSEVGEALYPLSAATIDRFCREPELFIPIRTSGR